MKDSAIYLRCTLEDRDRLRAAAAKMHLPVTTWIRGLVLREADALLDRVDARPVIKRRNGRRA